MVIINIDIVYTLGEKWTNDICASIQGKAVVMVRVALSAAIDTIYMIYITSVQITQ